MVIPSPIGAQDLRDHADGPKIRQAGHEARAGERADKGEIFAASRFGRRNNGAKSTNSDPAMGKSRDRRLGNAFKGENEDCPALLGQSLCGGGRKGPCPGNDAYWARQHVQCGIRHRWKLGHRAGPPS